MPIHVNDGGVWKEPEVWVNDNGTWKRAEVSVNDAGTWKVAASLVVAVSIAPTSRTNSNINPAFTFASCVVTVTGGTPTSYTWGLLSPAGGTWAVNSGQGTNTATARVSGVASNDTATATFYCDVVVNGQTYRVTCPHTFNRLS